MTPKIGNPLKQKGPTAKALVALLRDHAKSQRADLQTAAADLLADFYHICDRLVLDRGYVLRVAGDHYSMETSVQCKCGRAYDPECCPGRCTSCRRSLAKVNAGSGRELAPATVMSMFGTSRKDFKRQKGAR